MSKRVAADNLSVCWKTMSTQEKLSSLKQVIGKVKLLQNVDIDKCQNICKTHPWYSTMNEEEPYAYLQNYQNKRILSEKQVITLKNILKGFFEKYNSAKRTLNHGDITMDNLLLSKGNIVSLLDFEHAHIAPSEIDIHSVVNMAFYADESENMSNYNESYEQYKEQATQYFKTILHENYDVDLFLGIAILFRMRFVEFWLANPEGRLEDLGSFKMLKAFSEGDGGYFRDLL